jgi:membrane fusion protein (multidrug efflux system)
MTNLATTGFAGHGLNGITESPPKCWDIELSDTPHVEVATLSAGAEAHIIGNLAVRTHSCGPGNLRLINRLYDAHRSGVPVPAMAAHVPTDVQAQAFRMLPPLTIAVLGFLAVALVLALALDLQVKFRWLEGPILAISPLIGATACTVLYAEIRRRYSLVPFLCGMAIFAAAFATLVVSFYLYVIPVSITFWARRALRAGMHLARPSVCLLTTAAIAVSLNATAQAQPAPSEPPAVGVIKTKTRPITETSEFLGRIEATNRVAIDARVTAFMDKRVFREGAEVNTGDLLYQLERGPFEADLATKQAQVAQLQATLENAKLTTERARTLLGGPAGMQSSYDAAIANQRSLEAQVLAAQAQVKFSQINLDYTEIRSPIDGMIGRTAVTDGNVVSPSSGVLTTIVSQDPMYVTFPVPVRQALELRERYVTKGGFNAVVIKVRLPNGRIYSQAGKLDFANNTIAQSTDTLTVRGVIPNPTLHDPSTTGGPVRELTDGEFVTVMLEGVQPVEVLAIPRSAVLSDQQGDYVFTVGADNKAEQRRIKLGQSTSTIAAVINGLKLGDMVIAEGLQRVRPGQPVVPGPASALVESSVKAAAGDDRTQTDSDNVRPAGKTP